MWVTERYAKQYLDMPDSEIRKCSSILVHAPNGITWHAYEVEDTCSEESKDEVNRERSRPATDSPAEDSR